MSQVAHQALAARPVVGIDVAKAKLDVVLQFGSPTPSSKPKHQVFLNEPAGHRRLLAWLQAEHAEPMPVCLEATGTYGRAVATFLHEAGYPVSIVNPLRIKRFGESELLRLKTDKTDAALIARFCQSQQPRTWTPPPQTDEDLQQMVRALQDVEQVRQQQRNRAHSGDWCEAVVQSLQAVEASLTEHITALGERIREYVATHAVLARRVELLCSIVGIGEKTAWVLAAELGDVSRFRCARELVAYLGLAPRQRASGSSLHAPTTLCKLGPAQVRKALYWPTISATRYNPQVKALYERLLAAGKPKMVAVGAAMHKLVRQVFGVLHSGQPFERSYQQAASPTATVPQAN